MEGMERGSKEKEGTYKIVRVTRRSRDLKLKMRCENQHEDADNEKRNPVKTP